MSGSSPTCCASLDPARVPWACPCGAGASALVHTYDAPPEGETRFPLAEGRSYRRDLRRCERCGHFRSLHRLEPDLYRGQYVDSTYGGNGLEAAFQRIISLDPAASDNAGRVRRIVEFAAGRLDRQRPPRVLDVGSGLGVFVYAMKQAGWACAALDPDPRSVRHTHNVVGVEAICADFMNAGELRRFDLVTFNKVLEHVADPLAMLSRSRRYLRSGGFVYVEVPDGERAIEDGPHRQEFFLEHLHAFSMASLVLMATRAGFRPRRVERLHEPSGKYTLWTFLIPHLSTATEDHPHEPDTDTA